ncbi:MAG: DUF2207 domain-containing protein [Actinomycetota bacterium]|nr:DUF2207 domain-containing protein [Actinomycetota bacterium]
MIVAIQAGSKFHGFTGASLAVLVAAFVAAALWLVIFAIRWTASFPRVAPPGPETSDLGPEPPAVANFLVNRFEVTRLAVGATLVDLAARGVIGIDEIVADHFVVRLRHRHDDDAIADYERQVLDLVRDRATGGSAPIEALEIGSAAESLKWWQRFAKSVERDARHRGLARNRWNRADWAIFAGGIALVLGLFALAFGIAHLGEGITSSRSGGRQGRWDWFYVAAFAELLALAAIKSLRGVRDTPSGRAASGRWLGVRRFLRHDSGFADLPPAAVAIWQRYLSYGIALGVARAAAHALPFGDEDPRAAWSRYGGNWHQVRVDYPSKFGYGKSPIGVFLGGLVRIAFWGTIAFAVLPLVISASWELQNDALSHENSGAAIGLVALFVVIFGVMGIYLLAQVIDGLMRVGRGGMDLGHSAETRGAIIRIGQDAPYAGYVAIDDGHSAETKAFFPPVNTPALHRGDEIAVALTPHLRHATALRVIGAAPQPVPTSTTSMSASAPDGTSAARLNALNTLDVNAVIGIVGCALQPIAGPNAGAPPGAAARVFSDGGRGRVAVMAMHAGSGASRMAMGMLAHHGQPTATAIEGFDGDASWTHNRLVARAKNGDVAMVMIDLANLSEAQRRDAACATARLILVASPTTTSSPAPEAP